MAGAADADDGVVVDVVFEHGLLFLEVVNLSPRPALRVACAFDPPLHDHLGREVARLPLFRRIEFLGPGRRIRTLLDSSAAYFGRRAPTRFSVSVAFRDPDGRRRSGEISHDLRIYRDLSYLASA